MAQNTRTINSTRNVVYGIGLQVAQLFINFIARTIFIKILGVEYLGINGLFTNILTLLSLSELGFGNAIVYSMYKPLANKDEEKIAALMNFYKKIYKVIALVVLIVGLILIPFLQNIISIDEVNIGIEQIRSYYILFLINSVVSYLFVYKTTIISVDQKMYLLKKYNFIMLCIFNIAQIIGLYVTHNYTMYLVIQILYTLGNNIYGAYRAKKMYPYIEKKEKLEKEEKRKIYSNVGSIFIYKLSGTILNNTDNILISALVSTILVGYYSNYMMIIQALLGIITIIFSSITASVGNLNADTDAKRKREVFEDMTLICFWILGITSICLMNGISDFVSMWVGSQYVLDFKIVTIIVLNYYIYGNLNPIWTFRDTTGIFKDAKNSSIVLGTLNLVLSILLGKFYGMFGIILATALSRLLTSCWYQPYVLYKKIFRAPINTYYRKQIRNIVILIIAYLITIPMMKFFKEVNLMNFILKMILSFIVGAVVIFLLTYKDKSTNRIYNRFKSMLQMVRTKRGEE